MKNKLLLITIIISFSGVGTLPIANGATTAELQAQITALLSQITALQVQLESAGTAPAASSYNYTRDLTVGSRGADVTALQNDLGVSPATGYFGNLTKAALAKWQAAKGVSPAAGYFGPKTRAAWASASAPVVPVPVSAPLPAPAPVVEEVISAPSDNTATVSLPAVPEPLPKLIVNDLYFKIDFPTVNTGTYLDFTLFDFTVESKENVAITRLRFKQTGTLADYLVDNIRLVDATIGVEIPLAKLGSPVNGIIEFAMVPDKNKINNGLVVPGRHYKVLSTVTVSYGVLKPTVSLSIEKSSDISAFDSSNLDRAADIQTTKFPIDGPVLVIS